MIETGQQAPDFTLNDADGNAVTLSQYRGRPVVVYFYPKDDTPGCTKEACSFRDNWEAITGYCGGGGPNGSSGDGGDPIESSKGSSTTTSADSTTSDGAGGIVVLGISADDETSHRKFADKHNLPFTLLADPEKKVIKEWGAWGKKNMYGKLYEGIMRYTYILDGEGVVRKIFKKVKTGEHAREVLEAIRELGL